MNDTNVLASLLAPMDEHEFFETYWEQKTLYLKSTGDRLSFKFDRNDFFRVLPQCDMVKMAFFDSTGQHREAIIPPDHAPKLFESGASICATNLDKGDPRLKSFLEALDDSMLHASTFNINGYLSPAQKGFGVHFDNHSVWVIQLEGSKTWRFSDEPAIPYPVTNLIYPLDQAVFEQPWYKVPQPDFSTFTEVVLEPGDVLYLPPGAWHETQASDYSLSLSLGQAPVYTAQFIAQMLRAYGSHKVAGRHFLPSIPATYQQSEAFQSTARAMFDECLTAMRVALDNITADQLFQAWKAEVSKGSE